MSQGLAMAAIDARSCGVQFVDVVLGVREKIAEFVFALRGGNDLLESQLLLAVVELHAAADLNDVITLEGGRELGEVVPHFRGDGSGAVGQLELQPGLSGPSGGADFLFANEKERGHGLAVGKIDNEVRLAHPLIFGAAPSFFFFFLSGASGVGATS